MLSTGSHIPRHPLLIDIATRARKPARTPQSNKGSGFAGRLQNQMECYTGRSDRAMAFMGGSIEGPNSSTLPRALPYSCESCATVRLLPLRRPKFLRGDARRPPGALLIAPVAIGVASTGTWHARIPSINVVRARATLVPNTRSTPVPELECNGNFPRNRAQHNQVLSESTHCSPLYENRDRPSEAAVWAPLCPFQGYKIEQCLHNEYKINPRMRSQPFKPQCVNVFSTTANDLTSFD